MTDDALKDHHLQREVAMRIRREMAGSTSMPAVSEPQPALYGVNRIERRCKTRFPFALDVRYRTLSENPRVTGIGHTINMSRSGLLIESEHELPVGARVEVTVEWPVPLDDEVGLQLVTVGRVGRSIGSNFVLLFRQYEFKTMKRKPPLQSNPIRGSENNLERSAGA